MIQRLQSIWLLLATGFNALTFKLPFYSGDWTKDVSPLPVDLNATTTPWLTIVTAITGLLALATIFLFGNRKLQLKLCYLGTFLALVLLAIYFVEIANFKSGSIALWALFYFAIIGCFLLAARGVSKDEKLVKSMDRLR
jgi:hypothetical protein